MTLCHRVLMQLLDKRRSPDDRHAAVRALAVRKPARLAYVVHVLSEHLPDLIEVYVVRHFHGG